MRILILCASLAVLVSCSRSTLQRVQGYVEGEYVHVASPRPGALETLSVSRGAQIRAGEPLFTLESGSEAAALDEAQRRLNKARADLDDLRKGKRPEEIAAIEAQLAQASAALALAEVEYIRQEELLKSRAISARDLDVARSTRDQERQRVSQVEAELAVARLGARPDQIAAAEATITAQDAAVAAAKWNLDQKQQRAPQSGLVFDTLYRPGEWVAAGRPVVVLLPPANIKVRAFVPEPHIAALQIGGQARVSPDGVPPVFGKITYISPSAEFTPPVIYSRESRSKLVYLVEVHFDPEIAATLHPGQPVDVEL